jgi:hypothetical protein
VVLAARSALKTRGPLLVGLITVLLVMVIASMVDTVEENRTTWLLLGIMAVAGRLAVEQSEQFADCFGGGDPDPNTATLLSPPHVTAE